MFNNDIANTQSFEIDRTLAGGGAVVVATPASLGTGNQSYVNDTDGAVGLNPNALLSPTYPFLLFALFQLKFAIITPALITGSFAERVKFTSYLIFMCLFSLLIYCPLAH